MALEDFVGFSGMGVSLILAPEEHLLHHLQRVLVVSLFDEQFSPSSPDGQAVLHHLEVGLGGLVQDLVAASQLARLLQDAGVLNPQV